MQLLGIDYGTKNIGLAIGDSGGFALPFGVIENPPHPIPPPAKRGEGREGGKYILGKIQKIIDTEGIEMIVLGVPQTKSGIPSKVTKEVLDFGEFLSKNLPLPIKYQNEQFTSKEVEKLFMDHKKEKKKISKDAVEAMLILQGYIDSNK